MAFKQQKIVSSYLLVSWMIASALLLEVLLFDVPRSSSPLFFLSLFWVANGYFYQKSNLILSPFVSQKIVASFFLFQFSTLLVQSFLTQKIGLLFLSFIPILAATAYFLTSSLERPKQRLNRLQWLYASVLVMGLALNLAMNSSFPRTDQSFTALVWFFLWSSAVIVIGQRRTFESSAKSDESEKEQFFAHDLINHSTALKLFMKNKKALTKEECSLVLNEIEALESLVVDHFQLKHQSLRDQSEWRLLVDIRSNVYSLIQTFLIEQSRIVHLHFFDSAEISLIEDHQLKIHFPSFLRIFSNLIKNASDHGSPEVEVLCRLVKVKEDFQMDMVIKSKLKNQLASNEDMAQSLSTLILTEEVDGRAHLGLESVQRLCEESGGQFNFSLEGQLWVNHLIIPLRSKSEPTQQGTLLKKAA